MFDNLYAHFDFSSEPRASTCVTQSSAHGGRNPHKFCLDFLLLHGISGRKLDPIEFNNIEDIREKKKTPSAPETISVLDIVNTVKNVFGLNNVQIADLIGVSRPSLYNHLSGKEDPKSMDEYLKIWQLAQAVQGAVSGDIKPGLKSVLVNGKTLLTHLKDGERSQTNIIYICQQIADKMTGVNSKIPSTAEQNNAVRLHSIMT